MTTPSYTFLYDTVIDNNTVLVLKHTIRSWCMFYMSSIYDRVCTVVVQYIFFSLVGAT